MHDYIVSIDPSITSTGICIYDVKQNKYFIYSYTNKLKVKEGNIKFSVDNYDVFIEKQIKGSKFNCNFNRYIHVAEHIYEFVKEIINDNVFFFIEGYAFAAKGKSFSIGEFGALLKRPFYNDGITMPEIAPSEWKLSIIGRGGAKKNEIYDKLSDTEFSVVLDKFSELGYPYKDKHWIEDICDVYAIQKHSQILLKDI